MEGNDDMMITLDWQINCPPETAFDLMADVRNEPTWNETGRRADLTSDEPVREGSTFRLVRKNDDVHKATITRFDRASRLQFAIETDAMDITADYSFEAHDGVTKFRAAFEPTPKGIMRVLLPVLKPMIRRQVTQHHREFSAMCEARVAASAPTPDAP
jgi:uncharacterized protein YndB with AHSA1/START domain